MENLTKIETNNHKKFLSSIVLMFVFMIIFELSIIKYTTTSNNFWTILFIIGMGGIILNTLHMFYIGYSYGWELKRIDTEKNGK